MDMKTVLTLFLLVLCATFPPPISSTDQLLVKNHSHSPGISSHSLIFPISGNVYPLGYYTVTLNIGNPPKDYELVIGAGSDLTWVQCELGSCDGCTLPVEKLYKPKNDNLATCSDPLCAAVDNNCHTPDSWCSYEVQYSDSGSSTGTLVRDSVSLERIDGSLFSPMLALGCGYREKYFGPTPPPSIRGVLGLGNGKTGILSQLKSLGVTRNIVVGHCFSSKGDGVLFFGDDFIPSSVKIVWIPIMQPTGSSGPADMFFNGNPTPVKSLPIIFDSGSSFTYLNSQAYQVVVDLIKKDLTGKPLSIADEESTVLPLCWKGAYPFKTLSDVNGFFKPITLRFTNFKNSQFKLPPQAYLIITQRGNVCLGILNGTEVGLENVIGDISMQDKVIIYDNEKKQIGWARTECA